MRAVVYHGPGDRRLEEVADPRLEVPHDVIVRVTTITICGTVLHILRGDVPTIRPGTVLGHEGVGVVEEDGAMEAYDVFGAAAANKAIKVTIAA